MQIISIGEFLKKANTLQRQFPTWRHGQTMFNTLNAINPELADEIRGTENDPYYNDANINAFLSTIAGVPDYSQEWNDLPHKQIPARENFEDEWWAQYRK